MVISKSVKQELICNLKYKNLLDGIYKKKKDKQTINYNYNWYKFAMKMNEQIEKYFYKKC